MPPKIERHVILAPHIEGQKNIGFKNKFDRNTQLEPRLRSNFPQILRIPTAEELLSTDVDELCTRAQKTERYKFFGATN